MWKIRGMENEECGNRGVCKMRNVENEECGKCGVWKLRSMPENVEYGKCGVWKMRKGTLNLLNLPVGSLRDTVTRELLMKAFLY